MGPFLQQGDSLHYADVKGKPCGVIKNKGSVTLHVGNICTSWTKDDLLKKLKVFDLENLEDVQLIDDPHNKGKNRGYAFLNFRTHMDVVAACANLQRSNVFFGINIRADITFSKTIEPDEEVMAENEIELEEKRQKLKASASCIEDLDTDPIANTNL